MQGLGLARPILTPFVTNSVMVISHLFDLLDSSQTEKISDLDQVWFYAQVKSAKITFLACFKF
jgi:hypothetical protein